jgi:hypothetical protein
MLRSMPQVTFRTISEMLKFVLILDAYWSLLRGFLATGARGG